MKVLIQLRKRFDMIDVESNFESRRSYRELLFKTKNLNEFISGIILYDETIKQNTSEGIPFPKYLSENGIIPGIKVDKGAIPLCKDSEEKFTEGLDGLNERLKEYKKLGAEFTKWRAIINIDQQKTILLHIVWKQMLLCLLDMQKLFKIMKWFLLLNQRLLWMVFIPLKIVMK